MREGYCGSSRSSGSDAHVELFPAVRPGCTSLRLLWLCQPGPVDVQVSHLGDAAVGWSLRAGLVFPPSPPSLHNVNLTSLFAPILDHDRVSVVSPNVMGMTSSVSISQAQLGTRFDAIAAVHRSLARDAAKRADMIDEARRFSEANAANTPRRANSRWDPHEIAHREFSSELACTLRIPEPTAENLIAESRALVEDLPGTLAALHAGEISYQHAQAVIGQACSVPADALPAFEQSLLPAARTLTAAKLKHQARMLRERLHPESIAARKEKSFSERTSWLQAETDGMATLSLTTSTETVHAIFNRANDTARSLQGPEEKRSLTQLRTDVLSDLLIDGVTPAGLAAGIRATVQITVPVLTLLGRSEEPGYLENYGPIDPDTARDLASRAPSFTRILIHPETGIVLSVGRHSYKVPKRMRRFLRLRDETCRFPGCNQPARGADLDHSREWQDLGQTADDNLAHLWRSSQTLKTETSWTVKQKPGGILIWNSPTGRDFETQPATWIAPPGAPSAAAQVGAPVGAQTAAQVGAPVGAAGGGQVGAPVAAEVRAQIGPGSPRPFRLARPPLPDDAPF
ncbi:HNH endonuclease [Cryobacterium shii]|uniref:HNH endonuclease n=2 Tax=Microbacteriaceae TaxID=85023 RepID=A0AAQ2C5H4_9MICO|nr:HNH endonuclease [Cryobacterium shii]